MTIPYDPVKSALALAEEIHDAIDDLPEDVRDKAGDFLTSVSEKTADIAKTIERLARVTPGQKTALDNMRSGVAKWEKS